MSNPVLDFKVSIVAPSRIGKTSLVSAILQDTEKLLRGTPLNIRAKDSATGSRLNQHKNQLSGALRVSKYFNGGTVSGTQAPFEFNLLLSGAEPGTQDLNIKLLDFPGGWLPALQYNEGTKEQRECAAFVKDSTVLLLAVDASMIMESTGNEEKQAIDGVLKISETDQIVKEWAKAHNNMPTSILICPVKCESYFSDNGGDQDRSAELYAKVKEVYQGIIETAFEETNGNATILYIPVDTIGFVEVKRAQWSGLDTEDPIFKAEFMRRGTPDQRARTDGKLSIMGAGDVLLAVARQMFYYHQKQQLNRQDTLADRAQRAEDKAKDKDFFQHIYSLFGGTTDNEKKAQEAYQKLGEALGETRSTEGLIEILANVDFGKRVKVCVNHEGVL
ncbi:hypothetical protein [Neokomagataea anthophila]|uniref:DUF3732 domain-containing protein n=1 Tax=Neokomagataea anthophila TaxID=2826925 RepID=A0ABS5E928_9PROT|nr:hypothetical protein [Neokomagataea anthophila]MBR0560412.1 hypothetical protein [Neokomagataea anthophila]